MSVIPSDGNPLWNDVKVLNKNFQGNRDEINISSASSSSSSRSSIVAAEKKE